MKEFILSSMDGERLKLPVNPASFSDEQSHDHAHFQSNIGEVKAIGRQKLRNIVIESFFPATYKPFCVYKDFPSPYECKAMIEKWKNENKPIRLMITETDINYAYTIDRFVTTERDGTGDVYYTLELSEYRFLNVPASHNPAPVQKISGLKDRPKGKAGTALNTQQKVIRKNINNNKSNPKPNKTAMELELYKLKSNELKQRLDKKLGINQQLGPVAAKKLSRTLLENSTKKKGGSR